MLEIDGEFFEDPCEIRKWEKILALIDIGIRTFATGMKSFLAGDSEEVQKDIAKIGRLQAGIIASQPLWPPSFPIGGIVVPVMTGDRNAGPELISEMRILW